MRSRMYAAAAWIFTRCQVISRSVSVDPVSDSVVRGFAARSRPNRPALPAPRRRPVRWDQGPGTMHQGPDRYASPRRAVAAISAAARRPLSTAPFM
jgi:hypothetical protein